MGQYSRPGQTEHDPQNRIGRNGNKNRTRPPQQDCQNSNIRTGLPGHDCQSRTARTGLSGRVARTGLLGQDGQDKTAQQNSKERTARTEELEKYSQQAQPMCQVEEDSRMSQAEWDMQNGKRRKK